MVEVLKIIENYLNAEKTANIAKWDLELSDEDAINRGNIANSFSHSVSTKIYQARTAQMFDDEDFRDFAPIKISKVQKRPLFLIRKYENPKCGDIIKRVLTDNTIYLCYCGDDEKIDGNVLEYDRIFVVANTDEGLKIVSYFIWDESKLQQLSDYTPSHISKLGKKVAVEKFLAPEEEASLADYNKD